MIKDKFTADKDLAAKILAKAKETFADASSIPLTATVLILPMAGCIFEPATPSRSCGIIVEAKDEQTAEKYIDDCSQHSKTNRGLSMHQHAIEHGAGQIRRIAKIGMGLNIILSILQIIVGYMAGSLALITDGFHTLSDMFSDIAVMIGVHFGSKEPDLEHPWGHGRMETFAATLISLVLIGVGAIMIYKSITSIYQGHQTVPNWAVLIVAASMRLSKEWLYWLARAVAKKTEVLPYMQAHGIIAAMP